MRRLVASLAASLLTLALTGPALAAPGSSGDHAVMYYLSLGDSLAASQQPAPGAWDNGYTEQLYKIAQATYPKLRHVKLGCAGGETTTTFIDGGVCDYPHGSQLDEAVSFLRAHRQFVAFVTIDLGWNDFPCQDSLACLPPGVASIQANLPGILDELRAAAGPDVPIVGATIYDPFLAYWLQYPANPNGRDLAALSVQAIAGPDGIDLPDGSKLILNHAIGEIYLSRGMPVADVEGAFFTTDWTMTPYGLPLNVLTVCSWTGVCNPQEPDNHPNDLGYEAMARAYAAALGL